MAHLTSKQIEQFTEDGYCVVEDVIEKAALDAAIAEYSEVLDRLITKLYREGDLSDRFEGLEIGPRYIEVVKATGGKDHKQFFDCALPIHQAVKIDTPFWTGQAVLNLITNEGLLDAVESMIGPEIYSNPVQHVRIKPPERFLPKDEFGNPIGSAANFHQDNGVVVAEADETEMLTVWFPLQDTAVEQGPLKVVPGSYKEKLRTHCPSKLRSGSVVGSGAIPEKLFEVEKTRPLPVRRGDAIFMHRYTVHGSLPNLSDRIRWSFDLRYNPIGQPTGRKAHPGFVARSRKHPERELRDAREWTKNWREARERMSRVNQGGQKEVLFSRWKDGQINCA